MDGIIIVALIAAFAYFSPASEKKITTQTKKELQQERPQRVPNQVKPSNAEGDLK